MKGSSTHPTARTNRGPERQDGVELVVFKNTAGEEAYQPEDAQGRRLYRAEGGHTTWEHPAEGTADPYPQLYKKINRAIRVTHQRNRRIRRAQEQAERTATRRYSEAGKITA